MAKNFKQLREEWMGKGNSDHINYCMPVNVGIIAQNGGNYDSAKLTAAVEQIMRQLKSWFGKFSAKSKTPSHNQLIVMTRDGDVLAGTIAKYLKKRFCATIVTATEQDIKQYCWVTIAAWDGIADDKSSIYTTIKDILSTINTVENDYKLRFPENRPIFQIVLPLSGNQVAYTYYFLYH